MRYFSIFVASTGLLVTLVSQLCTAAIFGKDDRIAIQKNSPDYELSRSTAVAVLSTLHEKKSDDLISLDPDPMEGYLCKDERFPKDPSLAYSCSGFLVGPDLLVTAGHCMVNVGESHHDTDTYCPTFSWLFDYTDSLDVKNVPAKNLYNCKEVIYAVADEKSPWRDFAVVRLDRPVTDRKPLTLAGSASSAKGPFKMIGYPLGTPAKLSWGAKLLFDNPQRQSFMTNLDAFEGNSGSAVFNSANEVVGILVGGTPNSSFIKTPECRRLNHCDENGLKCVVPDTESASNMPGFTAAGSEVQRIQAVIDFLRTLEK